MENEVFLVQRKHCQELIKYGLSKNAYKFAWKKIVPGSFYQAFLLENGDIVISDNTSSGSTVRLYSPAFEFKREISRRDCHLVSTFGCTLVYRLCGKCKIVMSDVACNIDGRKDQTLDLATGSFGLCQMIIVCAHSLGEIVVLAAHDSSNYFLGTFSKKG